MPFQEKGYLHNEVHDTDSLGSSMHSFFLPALGEVTRIPTAYERVATLYQVPPDILYSIALAESGFSKKGTYHPWPWTLNVEGAPKRFNDAGAALTSLMTFLNEGKRVDIGIMQVNSYWHRHRVQALGDLLNPYTNLKKGAEILREQRQRSNTWWEAVGRYHAPGNDEASLLRAKRYRSRVKSIYEKYVRKMT